MTGDCCGHKETLADTKDCLSDTTKLTSKVIGVKFRKYQGNIKYSTFPPGWTNKLCSVYRGGGKFKLFSVVSGFPGQIFTGKLLGVDSAGALRQGVIEIT